MSDLIEKVTAAINGGFTESEHAREKARAAIAAVAEWMIDEFSYQAEMIEIKEGIDAALRAAAGGGE